MLRPFQEIERWGDRIAVVQADDTEWSYAEVCEQADRWAEGLDRPGGLVAIEVTNAWSPLLAWIGASRAGFPVLLLEVGDLERDPRLRKKFSPDFEYTNGPDGWQLVENRNRTHDRLHPTLRFC